MRPAATACAARASTASTSLTTCTSASVRYGADPAKGENDFAAKVEYQFVPHWSVEAYGGNAAYGADLVWSREY